MILAYALCVAAIGIPAVDLGLGVLAPYGKLGVVLNVATSGVSAVVLSLLATHPPAAAKVHIGVEVLVAALAGILYVVIARGSIIMFGNEYVILPIVIQDEAGQWSRSGKVYQLLVDDRARADRLLAQSVNWYLSKCTVLLVGASYCIPSLVMVRIGVRMVQGRRT
jgi:hypothetical protein